MSTTIVHRNTGNRVIVRGAGGTVLHGRGLPGPAGAPGADGAPGDVRLITTSSFDHLDDDQAQLEACFEALANDMADGNPEEIVGVGIRPGQTLYLEEPLVTPPGLGPRLYGPGALMSEGGAHDNEMLKGWLRAAPSFAGTTLLHIKDWLNFEVRGVNFSFEDVEDDLGADYTGIGTESTDGRGTAHGRFVDCSFRACSRPIWMGQFSASPLLDSDCLFSGLKMIQCPGGITFGHHQSVDHVVERCWSDMGGDMVEMFGGGNIAIRDCYTYLQQRLLRVYNVASNGGNIRVSGCRFDGSIQTQLCFMESTIDGNGRFVFEDISDLWDGYSIDTDDPAIVARARQVVDVYRCDLSRVPETGGGGELRNRLVSVLNAGNADRGRVTLHGCALGHATLANNLGAMDNGHSVKTRDCYVYGGGSGQAITDVADSTYTGGA